MDVDNDNRLDALARVRKFMPDDDLDTHIRMAEWAITDSTLIDPERVDVAARAMSDVFGWDFKSRVARNNLRSAAMTAITAYLTATNDTANGR